MKRLILVFAIISMIIRVLAQEIRPTAVPLATIDPYFSCWSFGDKLNEQPTKHWTGANQSMKGYIRVDGKTYRFMGKQELPPITIVSNGNQEAYSCKYTILKPADNWMYPDFDDSKWFTSEGSFGNDNSESNRTNWGTGDIWLRRQVEIKKTDLENIFAEVRNDDGFELYINGKLAVLLKEYSGRYTRYYLTAEIKKSIKKEKNVVAVHCKNTGGPGFIDFGFAKDAPQPVLQELLATQKKVTVTATQSIYDFTCDKVDLKLTFTSPLLMDDLNLLSRPVSYVTYEVKSTNKKQHDVQIYFDISPEWCIDSPFQPVTWGQAYIDGFDVRYAGSKEQNILKKKGDDLRIDWGYLYFAIPKSENNSICINKWDVVLNSFINNGILPEKDDSLVPRPVSENPAVIAMVKNLGKVGEKAVVNHYMIAYDDIYSIQYFENNLKAFWKNKQNASITKEIIDSEKEYEMILKKCNDFDKQLFETALKSGGKEYAQLCALAYRQAISAHKLVQDKDSTLYFFSKENYSNGSIGTVDVTYPSAPLFLLYNPELAKGLINFIFNYRESAKWQKKFAPHDLGTYPIANGQTYPEDMPVEECGNILILTAAIAKAEKNANYAKKHWKTLTEWAQYLKKEGFDPEKQLCTDDFAGHLAHNANLSIKAILGLASYGTLAGMNGDLKTALEYKELASEYAKQWMEKAKEEDHYVLAFDNPETWSQKYNLVWDKLLNLNIFPEEVAETEIKYYLTKQNKYGLPLDSRKTYTKSDWIVWTATMASSKEDFLKLIHPLFLYVNESPDRIPLSDWHETTDGKSVGFRARSVVGGYFIKMLGDKFK